MRERSLWLPPAEGDPRLSRPETKRGRTQRVLLARLADHAADPDGLPTDGRFLFYELEQRGQATKPSPDDHRPNKRRSHGWPPGGQDVTDALLTLRERAVIPWWWITDETRGLADWRHAATVLDFLRDEIATARINPWSGPPPLLLTESRAMAGVLERVAADYCCPVTATAGQCRGFLVTEVGRLLADEPGRGVLYLGDSDRQGIDIEANSRRVLQRAAGQRLAWRRLAVTAEQAEARGIDPIWKVDGRDRQGGWAIEVEALGQRTVIDLVRGTLDALLPEPLSSVLEREAEQRRQATALLRPEA